MSENILIVTHDFPGNGGGGRFKIIKNLPYFGYRLFIITNKRRNNPFEDKIIKTELNHNHIIHRTICFNKSPFRIFSRVFRSWATATYLDKMFFFPDLYINWVPSALLQATHILRRYRIACVITSSPPESVHITGLLLKRFTHVRWIADFRDLWTTKSITNWTPTVFHGHYMRLLEEKVYAEADHILANTYGNSKVYLDRFGLSENKVTVITNGYEEKEINESEAVNCINKPKILRIGYMGYFDKTGFPWQEFLLGLKTSIDIASNMNIEVRICGHVSDNAKQFISKHSLSNYITLYGVLSHEHAMRLMLQCDVLLLLMYQTSYSKAIVPHKIYPYLGMSKPIFALAEDQGEVADIIRRTGAGKVVSSLIPGVIAIELIEMYKEWRQYGFLNHKPNHIEIKKYESMTLTGKLAAIIRQSHQE